MIKLIDNHYLYYVDNDGNQLLVSKEALTAKLYEVTPIYLYHGNDLEHPEVVTRDLTGIIKELWELARQRKSNSI